MNVGRRKRHPRREGGTVDYTLARRVTTDSHADQPSEPASGAEVMSIAEIEREIATARARQAAAEERIASAEREVATLLTKELANARSAIAEMDRRHSARVDEIRRDGREQADRLVSAAEIAMSVADRRVSL